MMPTLRHLAKKYNTDKQGRHCYIDMFYESAFEPYRHEPIRLLEIGVYHGASMKMWEEYFTNGEIIGIDIAPLVLDIPSVIIQDAYTQAGLDCFSDGSFDIIIDDGSHNLEHQLYVVRNYMRKLRGGGMLIIEDISTPLNVGHLMATAGMRRNSVHDLRYVNGRYDDIILVVYA